MHDEAGVPPEGRAVRLGHVVGVGVPAQPGVSFEEGDIVFPVQDIGCRQACHSAADDGNPPPSPSTCCCTR